MKKLILSLSALLISSAALAITCPDPSTFKYTECGSGESCKYHVTVPQGTEGWFPSFHSDRVDTKNLQFHDVSWGKPHDSYRMICFYKDPNSSSWFYTLKVLSEKSDYKPKDFQDHPNWYHIGNGAYGCQENQVEKCAFGG